MIKLMSFKDDILREVLPEVKIINDEVKKELKQMLKILQEYPTGVGIAANQCNVRKRMFIISIDDSEGNKKIDYIINPKILRYSKTKKIDFEGCLSDPEKIDGKGVYGLVERSNSLSVTYKNIEDKVVKRVIKGFEAVVFQHEYDHINGIIFRDKLIDGVIYTSNEVDKILKKGESDE